MGNLYKREVGENSSQVLPLLGWRLSAGVVLLAQDPAKLALKLGLLLQAWPQDLYLKHIKIHGAGLCQDFVASVRVQSHFVPSFSAVSPQVFQREVATWSG